ncbi:ATP-binding cassette domain-containing protein [Marinomonas sp. TI.3.20]|uniref:thiamine ABC transporter ATP-binding protein n=1 Tax=Marinomonas sp. TI.3.20 TaxID=3121296 RepID=UPI00311E0860
MLEINLQYNWENFRADYQVSIEPGMTTLLGASGEGKSTLLQLVGGYLNGRGTLSYLGEDFSSLAPYERPVTTLFQSDNLFPQLTVWQNVAIGLEPSLKLTDQQQEKVSWALEQTQLMSKRDQIPQALSGGQAQRVAIARVLVRNKPILLLDEPFSALDPMLREEMLALVHNVTEQFQLTTVLVSHMPSEALLVGGRVMLIAGGRVVAHESADVLASKSLPDAFSNYLGLFNPSTKEH